MSIKSAKDLNKLRIYAEIKDLKKQQKWEKKMKIIFIIAMAESLIGLFLFSIFLTNKDFWLDLTTFNARILLAGFAGMLITVIFFLYKSRKVEEDLKEMVSEIKEKYGELRRLG